MPDNSGLDLVGLVQEQERFRQIASSYDGFQREPGLAASLLSAGASTSDVAAVGGFTQALQLSQRVLLARQSGVKIDLTDTDRGLLAAIGTHYDDIDRRQINEVFHAEDTGVLSKISNVVNHVTSLPGVHQAFSGLDRVADMFNTGYRVYAMGQDAQHAAFGDNTAFAQDLAEGAQGMQANGYGRDPVAALAFLSRGKQMYRPMDDLRDKYGTDLVRYAQEYVQDPDTFMGNQLPAEELAKRDTLLKDGEFGQLLAEVDARHYSPGRDLALGLHLQPGSNPYTVVSGSADAIYSFAADPTIALGKARAVAKISRYGIRDLSDSGRIRSLMENNRQVRRGWTNLLDAGHVMRSGTKEEAAAAYAGVHASTPELLPVLDDIHGRGLRDGRPIETYADLVDHVAGTDALIRLRNGLAAEEAPLMPGALSRYGAAKLSVAKAATRHGLRVVDLTDARLLPSGTDAVNGAGEAVDDASRAELNAARTEADRTDRILAALRARGATDEEIEEAGNAGAAGIAFADSYLDASATGSAAAGVEGNAQAVGEAARAWRKSARGRAATLWTRMSTLLPEHSAIDLRSGQGAEDVRRFAALYMPRSHANALAARYSVATVGERRAIAEAVHEQVMHAAGLPSGTSGRAWLEAERVKRAHELNSRYDATGDDHDLIQGVDGEVTRREALYFGQTSNHFVLPNIVQLRRVAAKVSAYDYLLRSGMESATLDKALNVVRTSWITSPASMMRQAIEAHLAAAATGMGPVELARSRAGLSTITARRAAGRLEPLATREVDAEFRPVDKHLRGWFIGKIATNMRRAEAVVGGKLAREEILARSRELHEADIAGDLNELKAVVGFGTRAAHQDLDEARELLDKGYRVSEVRFKRAGWELQEADGLGGAKAWADELGRRFAGPEAPFVIRAATAHGRPPVHDVETMRKWAAERKHPLPPQGLGKQLRDAYAREHAPLSVYGKAPGLEEMRQWWAAQGKTLPLKGLGRRAREAYAKAHPPTLDRDNLIDFMVSDDFKEARAVLERFSVFKDGTKVGDDPDLLRRAATELADDQIADMTALIMGRDGEINMDLVRHLHRENPVPSVSFLHSLGEDARPTHLIQPKWVPNLDGPGGHAGGIVQGMGWAYEHVVTRPMQWLASTPIFAANYARAFKSLEPAYRKLYPDLASLDPDIERVGRMGEMDTGEGLADELRGEMIREAALQHAMDATVKLIDNPRVRSQMALITRNMFNFWRAQEDFARRWAGIVKAHPESIRKGQLIVEGGMHTGLVHKDENGELVFSYPGSGWVIQSLGRAMAALGGKSYVGIGSVPNLTTKLQFLNSGLDRPFLPSTSPVASIPLRAMRHVWSDNAALIEAQQIAEGDIGSNRGWWSQFMPSPVYRLMAAQNHDEREGQYASATRNAMLNLFAAGLVPGSEKNRDPNAPPPSIDDLENYRQRIKTGVRNHLTARALLGLILPGAPGNPTEETDASAPTDLEKGAFNSTTLQGEFRTMVSRYGYQKALAVWTESHPDDLVYTISTTEGKGGSGGYIGPTAEAMNWMNDNPDLIKRFPSLAAYFAPDGPGDFSDEAWKTELELGLRQHKDLDTFYRDVVTKNAETAYYKMRDQRDALTQEANGRGDDDEAKRIASSFSEWSQFWQGQNPLLQQKWKLSDVNSARAAALLNEVDRLSKDPASSGLDPNGDLTRLVAAYNRKGEWDATHKGRTDDDVASRQAVDESYTAYVGQLLGRSPYLIPLYRGVYDKVE